MLTFPAPSPLNGKLLAAQLGAAGVPSQVALVGSTIELADLDESDRATAQGVVDAHPATAQAALDKAATERDNETSIEDAAAQALAANKAFLALSSPTNAQNAAQVKALTRQVNALIRLLLGRFDGID